MYGNISGLGPEDIKRIQHLYRRRIPPDRILTHEFARNLTEISRQINRQTGVLISRRGEIRYVIVGNHKEIVIPNLDGFRAASTRLKGLRLVHTHLSGEPLTQDDLTDLALLRLDLVSALEVGENGLPGKVHTAHLIPENPDGRYWAFLKPSRSSEMDIHFLDFIYALEDELAGKQKSRRVDLTDRAILVRVETDPLFDGEASLDELKELARTCGVEVFDIVMQRRRKIDPRFLMGKGKLAELVIRGLQIGANLLIFDHELAPAQVRSITNFTDLKVIDRTQLILDIFSQRAHNSEGKIQVELAQLKYLLPRLIAKNTAMSRLTGGIGGRGPGETKLEINRRRVRDRIVRLEKDLKKIQKMRIERRRKRKRKGLPIISIIGYTNAGKSTLLNALTQSDVLTEDLLFATLDPKSSRLRFPRDTEAVITDTVGFIRHLPRELFAAFRATFEELHEADLLLHIIDVCNPNFEEHIQAVENILEELDLTNKKIIRVFNKQDLFRDKVILQNLCNRFHAMPVSALNPETFPPLMKKMEETLTKSHF
ncbi:MAG: GTPase HflX [Desulfobacteraceae bacterium 4484_190.3]|nr:MAG: GTPase HflX [Desulfobacteraceae bacterium 4484_190.3]